MSDSSWTEYLRCPRCDQTGEAELFEVSLFQNQVVRVSGGFEIYTDRRGSDFRCKACLAPAVP
jgi:hypothetical protein